MHKNNSQLSWVYDKLINMFLTIFEKNNFFIQNYELFMQLASSINDFD